MMTPQARVPSPRISIGPSLLAFSMCASSILCMAPASARAQRFDSALVLQPVAAAAPQAFAEQARATSPFLAYVVASGSSAVATYSTSEPQEIATAGLPDDPGAALAQDSPRHARALAAPATTGQVAPLYSSTIDAGWTGQTLTAGDKVIIGLHDLYSPMSLLAIVASAGYEQAVNGAPNYGVDRGAFGERLGAAGIRESSQTLFTESVFAPILHEDPRYYVEGPGYNFFHRTLYAVTRTLVTRTDSGHNTVNAALLLGYGASTAISYGYYPAINQNAKDMVSAYGGSLGGSALGFFVSEFVPQVLQAMHLEKKP